MQLQNTLFEDLTKHCPVPLHHLAYTLAKFEAGTSNGLEGYAFLRKFTNVRKGHSGSVG